jgi:hypothetical protein
MARSPSRSYVRGSRTHLVVSGKEPGDASCSPRWTHLLVRLARLGLSDLSEDVLLGVMTAAKVRWGIRIRQWGRGEALLRGSSDVLAQRHLAGMAANNLS